MLALLAAQLRLIVAVAGLGLVAYGCSLAWLPLAFIVPGALLLTLAVVGAILEARARAVPQDRRAGR